MRSIAKQMHDYRGTELRCAHARNIYNYYELPPKILDMACGEGALYSWVLWADYTGIDIDPDRIEKARNQYKDVDFRVGDCTDTGIESECADCIVSCETFEHISNWKGYLNEMARVLKPGGILSFSTPSTNLYKYPSYFLRVLLFDPPAPLRVMFNALPHWERAIRWHPSTSKKAILRALSEAGFEILSYRTVLSFYEHHYIYRLLKMWERIQPDSRLRERIADMWMKVHSWLVEHFDFLGTRHVIVARKAQG